MSRKKVLGLFSLIWIAISSPAQEDTSGQTLGEIIISVNKWEQKLNEVPNKISKLVKGQILRNNPQTSADLVGLTGAVFIQKSQLGGGSPMIRGFATNRVLLVFDGVRMNNAIYRSGNLQNIISIDPLSIEAAEVIFGPGSIIYGSDAIGGVMDFHSLEPRFATQKKLLVKGSSLVRYSSANKEKTGHADINLAGKKISVLTSFSFSSFDDLKMGKFGGQEGYLRPEYIERINGSDIVIPNSKPRVQKFSGYEQLNFLQKIRYKASPYWDMQYGFTYAETGVAPRYDRLIQYRNGALRFAEWNYGPMVWRLHNFQVLHSKSTKLFDDIRLTAAIQDYEESRIDRARNSSNRNLQQEKVDVFSINFDATKAIGKAQLFYGVEYIYNKVHSIGERKDINTGAISRSMSRYPDGSDWSGAGIYSSYKINLDKKLTLLTGLRFNYNKLKASFDTSFIQFPYSKAELEDAAVTGNAGIVYRPSESWQLNANVSTGYRMPNIDDIGKLFESAPGNITIPNPDLEAEYAWNFELGLVKNVPQHFRIELNGFHTILQKAIVRRPTTINGEDSIDFEGILSRVESLQNVSQATVWGLQASMEIFLLKGLSWQVHANWITGKETDDVKNEQVPLRHAPPFYGSSFVRYRKGKFFAEGSILYNSEVSNKDLAPVEQAKTEIYASDSNGLPYSPSWYTINFKTSFQLSDNILITGGWENISNVRYRPYSSGIVAAGSNLIISGRISF